MSVYGLSLGIPMAVTSNMPLPKRLLPMHHHEPNPESLDEGQYMQRQDRHLS
jgi:hypothetical protein